MFAFEIYKNEFYLKNRLNNLRFIFNSICIHLSVIAMSKIEEIGVLENMYTRFSNARINNYTHSSYDELLLQVPNKRVKIRKFAKDKMHSGMVELERIARPE